MTHFLNFRSAVLFALVCVASGAAWAQAPSFTTQVPGVANQGSSVFILLPLVNSGTATATSVHLTSITLGTLKPTTPSSLPLNMGTIAAGAVSFANLAFNDTSLITGNLYTLTVHGSYLFNSITSNFSVTRSIKFGVPTVFQLPASPMSVSPTPDLSRAVTKMVSAKLGGVISAKAASGAVFTLTIPANALLSDAPVTLTPLINVSGLPISNGFVAGVEVTPDELELMQLAKLTIQPPISVAINQQVGFSFHGTGQEFFFYPLDLVSSVSFSIHQFNAYGLGLGNITKTSIPTDMFDRLENELEPISASQRTALPLAAAASLRTESLDQAASSTTSDFATQYADMLQTHWEQITGPQLQAAEGPGGTMASDNQALVDGLKWARTVMLLGFDSDPVFAKQSAQAWAAIPLVAKKDFAEAFQLCSSQPGPPSVARLIGIVRTLALLGDDPATVLGSDYQTKINECARELSFDFDSEIKGAFSGGLPVEIATNDSLVQASGLKLKWNNSTSDPAYEVQNATLNYLRMSYMDGTSSGVTWCSKVVSTPPGTITVRATPSVNRFGQTPFGKQPPFSMIVQIFSLSTFEQVLSGVVDPLTGKCLTPLPPKVVPFYSPEFFTIGGRNEFVMPLNSVKSFMRNGAVSGNGITWTVHEVNTTVTLNGP